MRRAFALATPRAPMLIAVALALALALALPSDSGPDEGGHAAYVAALSQGHLPIIPDGQVADAARGISWQGQHPPLFYILATPFYILAGKNPVTGLLILRLMSIFFLAVTVALVSRLPGLLLAEHEGDTEDGGSPGRAGQAAAWIMATHPTVVYVCAMANNEAMSLALSVACVWAALKRRQAPGDSSTQRRWLLLTIVLGGLGLLTKLTAITGVVAAAVLVAQDAAASNAPARNKGGGRFGSLALGALVCAGAVAMWLPWGLYMHAVHGVFVPSPLQRPAFTGGLWALTLYPLQALSAMAIATGKFGSGFLFPNWLLAQHAFTYYPVLAIGWLVCGWVLFTAARRPAFRFVGAGTVFLWVLLINQALFRDVQTVLFMARYSPLAIALACLAAATAYAGRPRRARVAIAAAWLAFAALSMAYVFYFFLVGFSNDFTFRQ